MKRNRQVWGYGRPGPREFRSHARSGRGRFGSINRGQEFENKRLKCFFGIRSENMGRPGQGRVCEEGELCKREFDQMRGGHCPVSKVIIEQVQDAALGDCAMGLLFWEGEGHFAADREEFSDRMVR